MKIDRLGVFALVLACGGGGGETEGPPGSTGPASTTGTGADPTSGGTSGGTSGDVVTSANSSDAPTSTGEPDASSGDATSGATTEAEPTWRSALYPADWTPELTDAEGRFLHDFSYAGYRNGEAAPGQELPAATLDVTDFGADAAGEVDATAAFQQAFDAAKAMGGAIVAVPPGLYRIDGVLAVTGSRIVVRGAGAEQSRLWFTRVEDMSFESHLEFRGAPTLGADVPLTLDGEARSLEVAVADAGAFAVGDDLAVGWEISPEFVAEHGMDGTWEAFNGQWQPFFLRTVVAVDPGRGVLALDVPLRYPARLRDHASVRAVSGYLTEVGLEQLGVANAVAWEDAWSQDQVYAVAMTGVKDAWVTGLASFASPGVPGGDQGEGRHLQSGGLTLRQSKRVTVADTTLALAEHRGDGGNGYLFEVMQSNEVLVRDCVGQAGRHNFIQNWGFGATGIVWLRVHSLDGKSVVFMQSEFGTPGLSEFHHSLATANLIDASTLDDGWGAVNRGDYSTGAGHSATQSVIWNPRGGGVVRSRQFGHGYVIGPAPGLAVEVSLDAPDAAGTAPEDWLEGPGMRGDLEPASLYEDQLQRRLGR